MSLPTSAKPYVLGASEGDERWFLGSHTALKVTGEQTVGGLAIVEGWGPRGHGSPHHIHHGEDEIFYVLEGELRLEVDDELHTLSAGMMGFGPRDVKHRFSVISPEARFLVMATPAGFENFVREASEPAAERRIPDPSQPDMDALNAAAATYQIEIIGPPLDIG